MITIVKFTAILAIAAILALSPFMTMTALAVKGDFGGGSGSNIHSTNNNNNNNNNKDFGSSIHSNDNNIKHFDNGGKDKQITPTVTKGGNNNIDRHFNNNNNNNNNFKNFERDNNNNFYKNFKHDKNDNFNNFKNNDGFRFNNHNNDNFRFHNDNHNNNHDNVKVIHKTVVVHDRDNNQRTIVINSNLQGTCFVTQSQAANVDNLVAQLLDQCVSVTIIQG
jgi:hypothetical protein